MDSGGKRYLVFEGKWLRPEFDILRGEKLLHNYVFFLSNALHSENKKNIFFLNFS